MTETIKENTQQGNTGVATKTSTPMTLEDLEKRIIQQNKENSTHTLQDTPTVIQQAERELQEKVQETTYETLTPEKVALVNEIKNSIDAFDNMNVASYGTDAQKSLASFSTEVLDKTRASDIGETGQLLGELMDVIGGVDIAHAKYKWLSYIPFFNGAKQQIGKYLQQYDSIANQIDTIQAKLEQERMDLLADVEVMEHLYQQNYEFYRMINLYIIAGKEKLREMREEELPYLVEQVEQSTEAIDRQYIADFEAAIQSLDKKVHDLEISKAVALQTAPQIRLIQQNDKMLAQKIQDTIVNTLPLWRSQFVIAIGMKKQKDIMDIDGAIGEMTNDLLKTNAQNLKTNTIELTKRANESTISVDTIKTVNECMRDTLKQTREINMRAAANRKEASIAIEQTSKDLANALSGVDTKPVSTSTTYSHSYVSSTPRNPVEAMLAERKK